MFNRIPTIPTIQQPQGVEVSLPWDPMAKKRATLYLFTPRLIPTHVRRPHVYKFDPHFIRDVNHVVGSNLGLNRNAYQGMAMSAYPSANRAILPSGTYSLPIDTSTYSSRWTFILIVDNDDLEGRYVQMTLKNRTLYWGFCLQEPVNAMQLYGRMTPNHACQLVITHCTELDIPHHIDAMGERSILSVRKDIDVVNPYEVLANSPSSEYLITPKDAAMATEINQYGGYETVPTNARLQTQTPVVLDSITRSPKKHVATVLKGIMETADTFMHKNMQDRSRVLLAETQLIKQSLVNSLDVGVADRFIGLDIRAPISLGDLFNRYGSGLNLVRANIPFGIDAEVNPQDVTTPNQVLANIITTALPSLMAYHGLSDLQFHYVSRMPGGIIGGETRSNIELISAGAYINEHPDSVRLKWEALINHLEMHLFPLIIANSGHFELTVSCNVSGATLVQLQLLDGMSDMQGWIVQQNLLGGIATPLVGTADTINNNGVMLNLLAESVILPNT